MSNYKKELMDICATILQQSNKYNIVNHGLTKEYKSEILEETKTFPEKISLSKRIKAIASDDPCVCKNCTKIFGDPDKSGFCSSKCYHEHKSKNVITDAEHKERLIEKSKQKYKNSIVDYDYIICKECGFHGAELTTHVQTHGLTVDEYKKKFNVVSVKCQKLIDNVCGENNPAYQHGGKYSPFSENFIYADTVDIQEVKKKAAKARADNDGNSTTIEYWLKKTDGDVEQAQELLSARQSTFSLEKCIEKHGHERGTEVWNDRQARWLKSLPKGNYSKISQKLFFQIIEDIQINLDEVFFAEHNGECTLKLSKNTIKPDLLYKKKVIEFDGDYWHGEKRGNQERDRIKDELYKSHDYEVLRVKERDYNKNEKETINLCRKFLIQ